MRRKYLSYSNCANPLCAEIFKFRPSKKYCCDNCRSEHNNNINRAEKVNRDKFEKLLDDCDTELLKLQEFQKLDFDLYGVVPFNFYSNPSDGSIVLKSYHIIIFQVDEEDHSVLITKN